MIKTFKLCSIAVIILTLFFSIKYVNGSNGNIYQDQFSFLNFFSGIPQLAQVLPTQDDKIKMRDFTIDTQGKSLFNSNVDIENDGKLVEYANGKKIKDWKIKYEKKGSSRGICEPPVINLSFDKLDSKGKAKELFTGLSTYKDNKTLQYQKIRLIPECDIWTDYLSLGDVGFGGLLNVSLREFIVHKIFREFKIPTADVLGFANINIVSNDTNYSGKTFRYMIIQRPQELDDQIPFTTQFNFKPDIYASGDVMEWRVDYGNKSPLSLNINNIKTGEKRVINFDPEAKMRFDLLTNFLDLSDMGFLHNEDGGVDINTGLVKSIPHGFDLSFDCNVNSNYVYTYAAPEQRYKDIFYSLSRDIFLNQKNLEKMLALVDTFPYENVNKELLKDFLRIKFYSYSKYYNSNQFADRMNKNYLPISIELPFKNDSEYISATNNFVNKCLAKKVELKGVSLSEIKNFTITPGLSQYKNMNFAIDLKTSDKALLVYRKKSAFISNLIDAKSGKKIQGLMIAIDSISGINNDTVGPYFEIPPNTTVGLKLHTSINSDYLDKGEYEITLDSFIPNNNVIPSNINYKTSSFLIGGLEKLIVKTPKAGETIDFGVKPGYTITWSGAPNRNIKIVLVDSSGVNYYITNPSENNFLSNNFAWSTRSVYKIQPDGKIKITDLPEGKYIIFVKYSEFTTTYEGVSFNVKYSQNSKFLMFNQSLSTLNIEKNKTFYISWVSKNVKNIRIDLMDKTGNVLIKNIIPNISNFGGFDFTVPKDLVLEKDNSYVLSITDIDDPSNIYKSDVFSIKENKDPVVSISSIKAKLNYNVDSSESSIIINSEIEIGVPDGVNILVPKKYAFDIYARNEKGNYLNGKTIYTIDEAKNNGENYELVGGKKYRSRLVTNVENLNKVFPGVYTFSLSGMSYGPDYNTFISLSNKSPNISNKLAVIGEKSPYINGVDDPVYYDKPVIIRGVRFGKESVKILVGKDDRAGAIPTNSSIEDTVSFIPKYLGFEKGFIPIQIVNKYGASNYYYIELK